MSDQANEAVAPEAPPGSAEKPKRPKHIGIREKIRAGTILERIERQALGELKPPMTKDELKAAEIALKKCIPDLSSITLEGGDGDKPILFKKIERLIVDPTD